MPKEVRSGPLLLRPWRTEDVPSLHLAIVENVDHLRPWMPWAAQEPRPVTDRYALVVRWAELVRQGTDWPCGIFLDGAVAGSAGLHQRRDPGMMEIGYWVHRKLTGRGIATVTSYLLTSLAFDSSAASTVVIVHDRANAASRAVPERLGYELAGEEPGDPATRSPGEEGVDCIWKVTRDAWVERWRDRPAPVVAD
jgi:ribosomal-protein-serine acetyltransferase